VIDSQRGGSRVSIIGVFVVGEDRIWWEGEVQERERWDGTVCCNKRSTLSLVDYEY